MVHVRTSFLLLGAFFIGLAAGPWQARGEETATTYKLSTTRSVPEALAALKGAVKEHKFSVTAVHDLQATLKKKGFDFDQPVVVAEVCSPTHAKRVLEHKIDIATALPCRVAIYRDAGTTWVATIPPRNMLGMFGVPELAPVAAEVQASLYAIMKAAAGK